MNAKFQRRIQRYGWDLSSNLYERSWQRQLAPAQCEMLERAEIRRGDSVLEIASGTGLVTIPAAYLVGDEGSVTATDISQGMLDVLGHHVQRAGIDNVTLARMGAEEMTISGQFDAALCALGLMYVPDPGAAVREMHRLLKPGGRMSLLVWGRREACGWSGIFPVVAERVDSPVCPLFFQLGTGDALGALATEAGFEGVDTHRIETTIRFDDEEDACRAAFEGGPVSLAWDRFDDDTRASAARAYLETIREFRTDDGYDIPAEFVVVTAKVPMSTGAEEPLVASQVLF